MPFIKIKEWNMPRKLIDLDVLSDIAWWHWALTIPWLCLRLNGAQRPIVLAVVLCAAMAAYYYISLQSVKAFPVQIRLVYLGLLIVGLAPGMIWIHWVQLAGTTVMIMFGYCLLGRCLRLLPYNRSEPLTIPLIYRVLWREPNAGGLLRWSFATDPTQACCSIRGRVIGTR
jgi:hypothetical protein